MEGAYTDRKLTIGNRESGTWNWFLVSCLSKCFGYFKTVKREHGIGNREPGTSFLFPILVYNTNVYTPGIRSMSWGYIVFVFYSVCVCHGGI